MNINEHKWTTMDYWINYNHCYSYSEGSISSMIVHPTVNTSLANSFTRSLMKHFYCQHFWAPTVLNVVS